MRELFGGDKVVEEHFGISADHSATIDGREGLEKQARFQRVSVVLDELSKEVVDVIHRGQSKFVHALNHDGSSLCEDPMILNIPVKTSRKRKDLLESCTRDGGVIVWIKPVDQDAWGMFIEDYLDYARPVVIRPSNTVTTLNVKKIAKMNKGIERIVTISKFWLNMTGSNANAIIKPLPANAPFPYELPYGYTTEEMDFLRTRSSVERFTTYLDVFHFDKAEKWWPVHMSVCHSRVKTSFVDVSMDLLAKSNIAHDNVQTFIAQATKNKSISFAANKEVMTRDGNPPTSNKPTLSLRAGPAGDGAGITVVVPALTVVAGKKKTRAPKRIPEEKATEDAAKRKDQEDKREAKIAEKAEKLRLQLAEGGGGRGGRGGRKGRGGRGATSRGGGRRNERVEEDVDSKDTSYASASESDADAALKAMKGKANVAAKKRKAFTFQAAKVLTKAVSAAANDGKRSRLLDSTAMRAPPSQDAPCCNIMDCSAKSSWLCMHPACFDTPYCDDHRSHRVHSSVNNGLYKKHVDQNYPYFHEPDTDPSGKIYGERSFGSMPPSQCLHQVPISCNVIECVDPPIYTCLNPACFLASYCDFHSKHRSHSAQSTREHIDHLHPMFDEVGYGLREIVKQQQAPTTTIQSSRDPFMNEEENDEEGEQDEEEDDDKDEDEEVEEYLDDEVVFVIIMHHDFNFYIFCRALQ